MLLFLWSCFWSDVVDEQDFVNEGDWLVFLDGVEEAAPAPPPPAAAAEEKKQDSEGDTDSDTGPNTPRSALDLDALLEKPFPDSEHAAVKHEPAVGTYVLPRSVLIVF